MFSRLAISTVVLFAVLFAVANAQTQPPQPGGPQGPNMGPMGPGMGMGMLSPHLQYLSPICSAARHLPNPPNLDKVSLKCQAALATSGGWALAAMGKCEQAYCTARGGFNGAGECYTDNTMSKKVEQQPACATNSNFLTRENCMYGVLQMMLNMTDCTADITPLTSMAARTRQMACVRDLCQPGKIAGQNACPDATIFSMCGATLPAVPPICASAHTDEYGTRPPAPGAATPVPPVMTPAATPLAPAPTLPQGPPPTMPPLTPSPAEQCRIWQASAEGIALMAEGMACGINACTCIGGTVSATEGGCSGVSLSCSAKNIQCFKNKVACDKAVQAKFANVAACKQEAEKMMANAAKELKKCRREACERMILGGVDCTDQNILDICPDSGALRAGSMLVAIVIAAFVAFL